MTYLIGYFVFYFLLRAAFMLFGMKLHDMKWKHESNSYNDLDVFQIFQMFLLILAPVFGDVVTLIGIHFQYVEYILINVKVRK